MTTSVPPSTRALAWACTGCGCCAQAAAKRAACAEVEACAGTSSAKSPPSGMQTSLQTSQSARSRTASSGASKPSGTVTRTGSSSAPS